MGFFGRFRKSAKRESKEQPRTLHAQNRAPVLEMPQEQPPVRKVPILEKVPEGVKTHQENVLRALLQHPNIIWHDESAGRAYAIFKHGENTHHIIELSPIGFDEIRVRAMRVGAIPNEHAHTSAVERLITDAFQELYNAEFDYKYGKDSQKRKIAEEAIEGLKTKLLERRIRIADRSPEDVQKILYQMLKEHLRNSE